MIERRPVRLRLAFLAALIVLLAQRFAAAASAFVATLPADRWEVRVRPGDTLKLTAADDTLRLDYDLDVRDKVTLGHVTFNRASARLLLKEPVALTPEQTRVLFEAEGIEKVRDRAGIVQLLPLIRDASGEILLYEPYAYPHLRESTPRWGKWMTRYFYGAEAGGATQNIFQPELEPTAGDGNAWPDGALAFIGFELQVQPPALGRQTGTLHLGGIELGGVQIPYEHPYAYADAFCRTNGRYRVTVEVATAFQALPVRETETALDYRPESPASRRQRITIPLGPDGNYWIRFQVTDADGRVVGDERLRYNVNGNPDRTALAPVPPDRPPVLGFLRVNPEAAGHGVYPAGAPLDVTARVFPKGAAALALAWRLVPYAYDTTIETGTNSVAFAGQPFRDVRLPLKGEPDRDACRLLLSVLADGKEADRQEYVLGRATDLSRPRATRQGLIRGRGYVKQSAYFRTTFNPSASRSEDEYVARFEQYLDEASQVAPYVTYMIDLAEFEVLPRVYDFAALDRVMDAAADRGCAITVRLAHVDQTAPFRWLDFTRQRSYEGTEIYHHFYGCFSPVDTVYLDAWLRANRALHARYKTHPGFQGYYVMMAGGEWSAMLDKPWLGELAGYDAPARVAFRAYLRENLKLSLDTLNQRWGTAHASWETVEPPLPDYRDGARPDMRLPWLDFCRFKDYLNKDFWFPTLTRDIRSYDTNRVVIVYCGLGDELKQGLADYDHGGGVPGMPGAGEGVALWEQQRVGAIQEPHHPHRWNAYGDPNGRGWVLDWDLYTMFSRSGGGGMNLHVYYSPEGPLLAHYGLEHAYDRYEKFKPIFRELAQSRIIMPPGRQIATYQDPTTLFCKHRTSFAFRLPDLSRWFELLTYAGLDYEALDKEHVANYKLVLPNLLDEVLSRDSIEMLDGYVRAGGRLIVSGITGRYCPELGAEPYPFLRRLGIEPPAGEYIQQGEDVQAKVIEENPLFDKGDRIRFYTLANLRAEPNRPEIREAFFRWPYRWIPQTDYFGYFRDHPVTNGQVLARFPSGGAALSRHAVGKGEAIVFWGIPDYKPAALPDLMKRAAAWAGVTDPRQGNAIPLAMEARHDALKRHYAIFWQETPGRYQPKVHHVPDGTWWVDELVCDAKAGLYTGEELRAGALDLTFRADESPLKVVRMIQASPTAVQWTNRYRTLPSTNAPSAAPIRR